MRGGWIQIPLLAGHWWPASETPFKLRFAGGPIMAQHWMLELWDFKGIRTSIDKKPYIFVIFQGLGGGGGPDPLWIRTWWRDHRWLSTRIWFYIDCHYYNLKMLAWTGVCEQAEHVSSHKNTWICIWKWNTATSRWRLEPIQKHIGVHTKALNGVNICKT